MHQGYSKFILMSGIGLIILLMAIGGISGIYTTHKMEENNLDFYQGPYATNIYIRNLESNFLATKNCINDIQIIDDMSEFHHLESRLKLYCHAIQVQLVQIKDCYKCDQAHPENLSKLFKQWLPIRDEIINSVKTNLKNDPLEITRGKGAQHVKKISAALDGLIDFANNKAKEFVTVIHNNPDKANNPDILDQFYQHPYAVSNAVRQIQAGILAIHRDMKDVATSPDMQNLNELVRNIDSQEQIILNSFKLVKKQFLGDQAQVQKAETLFRQWRSIRQQVINRRTKQLNADYKQIAIHKSDPLLIKMQVLIEAMKKHADDEASTAFKNSKVMATKTISILAITIGMAIIVSIITAIAIIYKTHNYVRTLHETQERLREKEENLRITLHSIADGVIVTDSTGKVVMTNHVTEKLSGWKLQEVQGKYLADFFNIVHSITRKPVTPPIDEVIREGKSVELENGTVLISRDGCEYHIEDSAAPIMGSSRELLGVVMVFRDVTQQKIMQLEMQNTQKMEALGQLAGGVAHEFNNLLQVILGFSEIFKEDPSDITENRIYIDHITNAATHGAELVGQLLDFTRKSSFKFVPIRLDEIIYGILKVLKKNYGENIELNFTSNGSIVVNADPNQIRQVIINLCNNARDAIGNEPGEILISIDSMEMNREKARALKLFTGKYGEIKIQDNGEGMNPKTLEKIFEPFFTTKDVGEGTGLGLSAVKGIVENHAGSISVKSTVNEGTIVCIYLPAVMESSVSQKTQEKKINHISGHSRKVIFADDDHMLTDLGKHMLEKAGFEVMVAHSGKEAIEICRKLDGKVDLLLFDIRMPETSGPKAYQAIRDEFGDIPIIYATGYDDANATINNLPGARAVLQKPYEETKLTEAICTIFQ